jgi:hypothetical protein
LEPGTTSTGAAVTAKEHTGGDFKCELRESYAG